MWKCGDCLDKQIIQGTVPRSCTCGRLKTSWMKNIQ